MRTQLDATKSRTDTSQGKLGSLGETAFGASTLPGEPSLGKTQQKTPTLKSSTVKPDNKSFTESENVAEVTDVGKKMRLVAPAQKQNSKADQPKFLLLQTSDQQKSSNRLGSVKTQVVVDLSDRRTYVYAGDEVIASYPIAVGKKGWETPTGSFEVNAHATRSDLASPHYWQSISSW